MSDQYLAEIRIFAGNFAPVGWAFCDGALLPIAANAALFSVIGTTYGGDGRVTMALPDLRARVPMHPGQGPGLTARHLAESTGTDAVTLSEAQMPAHRHAVRAHAGPGGTSRPGTAVALARTGGRDLLYQTDTRSALVAMDPATIAKTGAGQAHRNMQPFLSIHFIIALTGVYPSQN